MPERRRRFFVNSRIVALALGALLTAARSPAADRPAPAPVFPTKLEEVHLTVVVRDATGHLVSNLKPDDFTVLENGRPQRVQLFGRAVEPGQEETLALDLGLLMDTSASMLQQLKLSQEAAVRFLESIPRARDLVTIFFDDDIRLSRAMADAVRRHAELHLTTQDLSITTFRYVPGDLRAKVGDPEVELRLDALNRELLDRVQRGGEAFVSNAVIGGRYVLRACIVNFHTARADVEALPEIVARVGRAIHAESR